MEFKYFSFSRKQINSLFDVKDIQISKKSLQMVVWLENVFKGNLMLQFLWLGKFS